MSDGRRRRSTVKEPPSEDWLMTYSDTITLLMAFFVMLFSVSKLDQEAYEKIQTSIVQEFGNPGGDDGLAPTPLDEDGLGDPGTASVPGVTGLSQEEADACAIFMDDLQRIDPQIDAKRTGRGLMIELPSAMLYKPGSAKILDGVKPTLQGIGRLFTVLEGLQFSMEVEGHTDSDPVGSGSSYQDNWELSVARATNVVRYFIEQAEVNPMSLKASGFADTRPKIGPGESAGLNEDAVKQQNRRVVIYIERDLERAF